MVTEMRINKIMAWPSMFRFDLRYGKSCAIQLLMCIKSNLVSNASRHYFHRCIPYVYDRGRTLQVAIASGARSGTPSLVHSFAEEIILAAHFVVHAGPSLVTGKLRVKRTLFVAGQVLPVGLLTRARAPQAFPLAQ